MSTNLQKLYNYFLTKYDPYQSVDELLIFTDLAEAVAYKGDKKIVFDGDIDFENTTYEEVNTINYITGDLYCDGKIKNMDFLQYIGGSLIAENSTIENLGALQYVAGDVSLNNSKIKNIGLDYVGGYADFENTNCQNLEYLQYVGKDLYLQFSNVKDLSSLEYVGGLIYEGCKLNTNANFDFSLISNPMFA